MINKFLTLAVLMVVLGSTSSCEIIPASNKTQPVPSPTANNTPEKKPQPLTAAPVTPPPAVAPTVKIATPPAAPAASTDNKPAAPPTVDTQLESYPLGIIGEIEPIVIVPFKKSFQARIDTGATTSSIHAENIKEFERDGKKWVSFDVVNPETKEKKSFRKRIAKTIDIVRPGNNETRYTVRMEIRFGDKLLKRKFTLANRSKLRYPVLIGRNVLAGLAVVDVTRKNTLK